MVILCAAITLGIFIPQSVIYVTAHIHYCQRQTQNTSLVFSTASYSKHNPAQLDRQKALLRQEACSLPTCRKSHPIALQVSHILHDTEWFISVIGRLRSKSVWEKITHPRMVETVRPGIHIHIFTWAHRNYNRTACTHGGRGPWKSHPSMRLSAAAEALDVLT